LNHKGANLINGLIHQWINVLFRGGASKEEVSHYGHAFEGYV
jgi:hypothetical protein